jgi:hypothetical protein
MPIWKISGAWKPARLAALAGDVNRKGGHLPEQIPDEVELLLGNTEELPLFPYRVSYRRKGETPSTSSAEPGGSLEMLRLELFRYSHDPRHIDPREFHYQPGNEEIEELTPFYVQRFGAETKLR